MDNINSLVLVGICAAMYSVPEIRYSIHESFSNIVRYYNKNRFEITKIDNDAMNKLDSG